MIKQKEFLALCAVGSREEIEEAIQKGAKVNKKSILNGTKVPPVFIAVIEENFDAIQVLLENGADQGEAFSAAIAKGKRKILKFLVDCGADVNQPHSKFFKPLILAVTAKNHKVVKWLLELGADVNVKTEMGYNALTYAALMVADKPRARPNKQLISVLMKNGIDYDEALIFIIKSKLIFFLDALIENGVDLNRKCQVGGHKISPLSAALFMGDEGIDFETVRVLIKNGADTNELIEFGDDTVTTPLNIAVAENRIDVADELLYYGADPDWQDPTGRTSLAYAVMTGSEITRTLLLGGADPDIPDNNGRTPLMLAALDVGYEPGVMEELTRRGADVNAQDNDGMTALMWVIATRDRTPWFFINGLIRTGGIMAEGADTWFLIAALYAALKREAQLSAVKFFLKNGADVHQRDKKGMDAIMCAMLDNDEEIVEILYTQCGNSERD